MQIRYDKSRKIPSVLGNYMTIARGIAETFGDNCEVVLHDLGHPESSLFFIAGNVTNRDLNAPVTDLVLSQMNTEGGPDDLLNYSVVLEDGRRIKSSIIFIRDIDEEIIGCLGINYDLTGMIMASKALDDFCKTRSDKYARSELFAKNVNEVIDSIISISKKVVDKPVPYMSKEDKIEVIKYLDKKGVFKIKGGVQKVARDLGVSRYTIYNYLKEIKC